ncbi:MAG: hypothetical protein ACC656_08295 [Candidatus Heimdallarchaeota archaeon]
MKKCQREVEGRGRMIRIMLFVPAWSLVAGGLALITLFVLKNPPLYFGIGIGGIPLFIWTYFRFGYVDLSIDYWKLFFEKHSVIINSEDFDGIKQALDGYISKYSEYHNL